MSYDDNKNEHKNIKFVTQGKFDKVILFISDVIFIGVGIYLALLLRFEGDIPLDEIDLLKIYTLIIFPIYIISVISMRLYNVIWQHSGTTDYVRIVLSIAFADILTVIINKVFVLHLSTAVLMLTGVLSVFLIGGLRAIIKSLFVMKNNKGKSDDDYPVMIVGAGEAGKYCASMFNSSGDIKGKPVLFVDDNPKKQGMKLTDIPIKGEISDIPVLAKRHKIKGIVIAIPSISQSRLSEILNICSKTDCQVRIMYFPQCFNEEEWKNNAVLRDADISDFLPRKEVTLDVGPIQRYVKDKVIFVTGGGGSIGSELCRQIIRFSPKQLIILDIFENYLYELQRELQDMYGKDVPIKVLIGSIRDKKRMSDIIKQYHPDVVFHAAAHKHVPLMENSPLEAIKNNVLGTRNVMEAASENGVGKFIQISTDKAVNPTNVMGATKRVTELLVQIFASKSDMDCLAVRFGNVLGSHGSVLPLMENQIKNGGPVTVTHPDIIRYFMTIPEASQLVLQAGSMGKSGTIYVLDMGEPVKIMDLATKLIRFHGMEPNRDIEIKIIGLRPGEKLYEELMLAEEEATILETGHSRIMQISQNGINIAETEEKIEKMIKVAQKDDMSAINILRDIVPNFKDDKLEERLSDK